MTYYTSLCAFTNRLSRRLIPKKNLLVSIDLLTRLRFLFSNQYFINKNEEIDRKKEETMIIEVPFFNEVNLQECYIYINVNDIYLKQAK